MDGTGQNYLAGNLGIGTGASAPTQALQVTGNVRFSGALMPNNAAGASGQVLTSGGAGVPPTWVAGVTGTGSANHVAYWNTTKELVFDAITPFYYNDTTHRLGLGTSFPAETLHVEGNLRLTGAIMAATGLYGSVGQVLTSGGNNAATTWTTLPTNPVTGTGAANYIAYWTGTSTLAHDTSQLSWDAANNRFGISTSSPHSSAQINGSFAVAFTTISSSQGLTALHSVIAADTTSTTITLTLPTAVGISGRIYTIKRITAGANDLNIATTSSQTIDGAAGPLVITTQWTMTRLVSDGANWLLI